MTATADNNDWHFSTNPDGTATVVNYEHPVKVWINGMETWGTSTTNCYSDDAEIPSVTPDGQIVTGIGKECFRDCVGLTSLIIPNTIKNVDEAAIYGCHKLKELVIPESVETMGRCAVWSCDSIERVIIGESPNTLEISSGYEMFRTLPRLQYIYQGRNVVSLDASWPYVFSMMSNSVETIEQGPMVTLMQRNEFGSNAGLKTFKMSPNVTVIPENAFQYCNLLADVEWSGAITSIGMGAFNSCGALKTIPDLSHCKEILQWAFAHCKAIERVVISASVDTLGYGAFSDNEALTELIVEDCDQPLKMGSSGMFSRGDAPNLKKAYFGRNAESTNYLQYGIIEGNESVEEITFAGSCSYLRSSEFANCFSLKSVRLGKNMNTINAHAFGWASVKIESLTTLICEAVEPPICKDGAFDAIDKEKCTLYVPAESLEAYKEANEWKDFFNIQPITNDEPGEPTLTQGWLMATRLADMYTARMSHQIMPVDDGIVVFGGHTTGFSMTRTAERYSFATDSWTQMDMLYYQDYSAGIVTADGKMLLAGGMSGGGGTGASAQCELYDPSTNPFPSTGSMVQARSMATATMTKSGKIYVNGCWYNSSYGLECYDPETESFSKIADGLNAYHPNLLALRGERVAIADGSTMIVAENGATTRVESDLLVEYPIMKGWDEMQMTYYQVADYSYILLGRSNTQAVLLNVYDDAEEGVKVTKVADLPMTLPDNESVGIGYHDQVSRVFIDRAAQKLYVQTCVLNDGYSPIIVEYDYPSAQRLEGGSIVVYATDKPLEHRTENSAWTMLANGRLVSVGGGENNFAPHKGAYIYSLSVNPNGVEKISFSHETTPTGNGTLYDLQGRQLSCPTSSGIYIRNGRKVFVP